MVNPTEAAVHRGGGPYPPLSTRVAKRAEPRARGGNAPNSLKSVERAKADEDKPESTLHPLRKPQRVAIGQREAAT
jgi:hypothetical protein